MNLEYNHIQFDQEKLNSIGYTNNTILELAGKFREYLNVIEHEYKSNSSSIQKDEISKMLHKLEGSFQYLALTGPINFLYHIRKSLESNTDEDLNKSIITLFEITYETITELILSYQDL